MHSGAFTQNFHRHFIALLKLKSKAERNCHAKKVSCGNHPPKQKVES